MSKDAQTKVTTHDDGKFVRTALVIEAGTGSISVVDAEGRRICLINLVPLTRDSTGVSKGIIVDVIDVDNRWPAKRMLCFEKGERTAVDVKGTLVSTDFREG